VTMGRGRMLTLFDVASQRESAAIDVGERPWGLALSPDGRTAYTANGQSNDVSIVDVAARQVIARVQTGDRPWGLTLVR
jgi:YVTN family beta-propeller protein